MAVTKNLKPIIEKMRSSPKFKRLKRSFDSLPIYQIPIEELMSEIETLHKMREIRRLNPLDPEFVDNLVRSNTNDQSIRSRITEILVTCTRASSSLTAAVDALRSYLIMTHSESLRSYRTKEERSYIATMALSTFTRYIERVSTLRECALLVVADIDKGNWSIRMSVDALKIHATRESRL